MALAANQTVGRQAELERLEGVLDSLDGGSLACLTIEGEPGIGKTRLLAELRERAENRGQLVLGGSARSSSATCRSASGSTRSTPTWRLRTHTPTTSGMPRC